MTSKLKQDIKNITIIFVQVKKFLNHLAQIVIATIIYLYILFV